MSHQSRDEQRNERPSESSPPDWRAAYDENGVDRSLIRSSLLRTPTECLDALEDLQQLAEEARRVGKPLR